MSCGKEKYLETVCPVGDVDSERSSSCDLKQGLRQREAQAPTMATAPSSPYPQPATNNSIELLPHNAEMPPSSLGQATTTLWSSEHTNCVSCGTTTDSSVGARLSSRVSTHGEKEKAMDGARLPRGMHTAGAGRAVPAYNFSFAMGGWLMIYNFGVAKCLLDHGLHDVHPNQSVIGSSAGALAATAMVLEADIDKIVEQTKTSFVPRTHAAKVFGVVYGMFHVGTYLRESMLHCLPVEKVRDKLRPGRLIVVMSTLLGWNSVRVRDISGREELIDALRCSCAVFPLVMPHSFRGIRCFDGVFSEGATPPVLTEQEAGGLETVTISPLYASRASIRPSRYVPLSWIALPPNDPGAIDWLYDLGYRDALFWMAKEGIAQTCRHKDRFSGKNRTTNTTTSTTTNSRNDHSGDETAQISSDEAAIKEFYVRCSFVLSGCNMRPRRNKHPQLDAEAFVPSLRQFVGHGTYHGVLDLTFVIFFHFVWKPAAALLIYVDLAARLVFAVYSGMIKELRPLMSWIVPTIAVLVVAMPEDTGTPCGVYQFIVAFLTAVAFVRGQKKGAPSEEEWKRARKHLKGLLEYRILLRCFPWGYKHALHPEVLETSFLYRAAAFFM